MHSHEVSDDAASTGVAKNIRPHTFLMEAAPELPEPQYLRGNRRGWQEKYTSSNTCTVRHVCSMSHVVQTYLSVVSVRSVSAPRWRKREKLFKNIFIYIQRLYLLIYKTIIIKLIVLFRKGDEVRQKSSLRTVVITSVS